MPDYAGITKPPIMPKAMPAYIVLVSTSWSGNRSACTHQLDALPHALLLRVLNITVYSKIHRKKLMLVP